MEMVELEVRRSYLIAFLASVTSLVMANLWAEDIYQYFRSIHLNQEILTFAIMAPVGSLIFCMFRRLRIHQNGEVNASINHVSVTTESTAQSIQLQLQDTLEQTVIALPTYFCAHHILCSEQQIMIVLAAFLFLIGRFAYYSGFHRGLAVRAIGLGLTFYSTIALIVFVLVTLFRD